MDGGNNFDPIYADRHTHQLAGRNGSGRTHFVLGYFKNRVSRSRGRSVGFEAEQTVTGEMGVQEVVVSRLST